MKPFYFVIGLFFTSMLYAGMAGAQLRLIPVQPHTDHMGKTEKANQRVKEEGINLPFWDDFSTYTGSPDTSLWEEGSGVYVNPTRSINPPTLGVATFDGATSDGGLYDTNPDAIGLADTLVSKPILLGKISSADVNSIYLSFFWEHEGAQEKPDQEDSLRLLFRNQNDEWVVIDVFTLADVVSETDFQQVIYKIKPEFLHNNFQFKFEDYGRLSGPYDAWHIDYVYLDKGRQVDDKTYFDRAVATLPAGLLNGYYAVPKKQFFTNPDKYLSGSSISIYNLDKIFQPIEYSVIVSDENDPSRIYATLNYNTPLNPILQGLERRILTSNPLQLGDLDKDLDSIYLSLKFYISSGDSVLPNGINYRINDTTTENFVIHDYYAYDDGTAEFGVGLDQNAGKIAYMFVLDRPDILNRVDISFININRNQVNTPFNLYVWKHLSDNASDVLTKRENQSVQSFSGFNQFQTIKLQETSVADTFYIGIEQLSSDYLVLGYDKNDNTGDRIFYNVSGGWQQNQDLKGSLMIRPYFNTTDIPLAIGESEKIQVKIFPNPASDHLDIEGSVDLLELINLSGNTAGKWESLSGHNRIDLNKYPSGLYILYYQCGNKSDSQKLVIRK